MTPPPLLTRPGVKDVTTTVSNRQKAEQKRKDEKVKKLQQQRQRKLPDVQPVTRPDKRIFSKELRERGAGSHEGKEYYKPRPNRQGKVSDNQRNPKPSTKKNSDNPRGRPTVSCGVYTRLGKRGGEGIDPTTGRNRCTVYPKQNIAKKRIKSDPNTATRPWFRRGEHWQVDDGVWYRYRSEEDKKKGKNAAIDSWMG